MRYTIEAKRVVDSATKIATKSAHSYIGADHLAVALLSSRDTEAVVALKRLRVPIAQLRVMLRGALPVGQTPGDVKRPMTPRLKQVLARASRLAHARDAGPIGTEDLLIGLLDVDGPDRERIASAIAQAANGSAYSHCVAADVL